MASIGGNTVIIFSGAVQSANRTIEDITRPGADGHSYRTLGLKSPASTVQTAVDCADATTVQTVKATYRGLVGSIVTVIDAKGTTHTNIIVEGVDIQEQPIVGAAGILTGSSPTFLVRASWRLRAV